MHRLGSCSADSTRLNVGLPRHLGRRSQLMVHQRGMENTRPASQQLVLASRTAVKDQPRRGGCLEANLGNTTLWMEGEKAVSHPREFLPWHACRSYHLLCSTKIVCGSCPMCAITFGSCMEKVSARSYTSPLIAAGNYIGLHCTV